MSSLLPELPAEVPTDLVPLPRAAALLLWTSAYLRGDLGPDDAVEVALGAGHRERTSPGTDLFDWMTELRRLPLASARLVLPVPGRIAGLIGPPAAITSAILAGQAIVVAAAGLAEHTLIPETEEVGDRGVRVTWTRHPGDSSSIAPHASSDGAREELLRAMRRAADGSATLDLVPEEPIAQAALPTDWTATALPRHVPAASRHLLVLAARTLLLTRAELEDPGHGGPSLAGDAARERILRELADASRSALVDQISSIVAGELA